MNIEISFICTILEFKYVISKLTRGKRKCFICTILEQKKERKQYNEFRKLFSKTN